MTIVLPSYLEPSNRMVLPTLIQKIGKGLDRSLGQKVSNVRSGLWKDIPVIVFIAGQIQGSCGDCGDTD